MRLAGIRRHLFESYPPNIIRQNGRPAGLYGSCGAVPLSDRGSVRSAGSLSFVSRPRRVKVTYPTREERTAQWGDRDSSKDKNEGTADKIKGWAKEAAGSLTGDKDKKSEGRKDQNKGTLKEKKGAAKDLLS